MELVADNKEIDSTSSRLEDTWAFKAWPNKSRQAPRRLFSSAAPLLLPGKRSSLPGQTSHVYHFSLDIDLFPYKWSSPRHAWLLPGVDVCWFARWSHGALTKKMAADGDGTGGEGEGQCSWIWLTWLWPKMAENGSLGDSGGFWRKMRIDLVNLVKGNTPLVKP
ncbi:hypothetical protein Droror1_Dr00010607 [Drosera rotundifolia]